MTDGGKYCQNIFQSTLLQEERLSSIKMEKSHIISIHAPTRGATDKAVEGILNILNFNPRSYKRSDCNPCHNCTEVIISIHAPTRGATWCYFFVLKFSKISIHAPTRGATGLHPLFISVMRISIHAPTRGATTSDNDKLDESEISIHAPTRGATSTTARQFIV